MALTLAIIYYVFLVAVFVFVLYSLFNIYHLLRFGFLSVTNVSIILFYIIVSSLLLYFAFSQLLTIDWSQPLMNFDGMLDFYKTFIPKI
jgi:hypothetical protein